MSEHAVRSHLLDSRIGMFNIRNLRRVDPIFVALVLVLAAVGLLVLYSASRSASSAGMPYYLKQAVWLALGTVLAVLLTCLDYRVLVSAGPFLYGAALLTLVVVEFFGMAAKGAERWLALGPIKFQPSELSKLALVLMLAWYLSTFQRHVRRLPVFLFAFVLAGVPCVLILKQPNLSTAMSLIPVVFVMLVVAGCRWWHVLLVIALGAAVVPVGWHEMKDYQRTRILTFMDPMADPQGTGWHTIQTKITVGSGGMQGKGFTKGTQTHLKFLPEHHTDFIFSLLAEEMGFVGATSVIGLFVLLLLRGLSLARDCPDMAGTLLVVGCTTILAFHAFVNVAITIGLMPVTGLPLPFLSYGGSFYLTTMMCIGVTLSAYARRGFLD